MMKIILGLFLGFGIGFFCSWMGIPSPAPPVLPGALLVLAMTIGYLLADRIAKHRINSTKHLCGGPTGESHSSETKEGA
jgi:XapX domain-containing protein